MGLGRLDDGLAPTPPMGWNPWNRFQTRIDERLIRQSAEALVDSGMRDAGFRYVVLDDGWMARERDSDGALTPDPERFPRGLRAVADEVHGIGLGLGIYTDAGTRTCREYPASLAYEFRDARAFAEWGVDYVKVDWCNTSGLGPRTLYAKWALALRATGRPILFSICEWGRARPWEWAPVLGHLWRTCWDIVDTWESFTTILDRQANLHPYAGPGHWNDPDMLQVGNGGMTVSEYRAQFSLWAMLAAPLMAGNDVRAMPEEVRAILTAPEVIAVDQDPLGRQGWRESALDGAEVWARELAEGARAICLFNRSEREREITTPLEGRYRVRDLWRRQDLAVAKDELGATVAPHDVALYRLTVAA